MHEDRNTTREASAGRWPGASRVLVPSENKRDFAAVPDEILNKLQPVFYTDPLNAAIRAVGLG